MRKDFRGDGKGRGRRSDGKQCGRILCLVAADRLAAKFRVPAIYPFRQYVKVGGLMAYGIDNADYTWINSTRYMGIFHEVQPASRALQCLECHSPKGRLDWKTLGYKGDPIERR